MMQTLHTILLIIHIATGAAGLLAGTINLIGRKNGHRHKLIGKVFTVAMLAASFSAIGLALINPNPFLLIIGVFTIYMVGTGYNYIKLRMKGVEKKPKLLDWVLSISMGLVGVIFLVLGVKHGLRGSWFSLVYLVFGFIGLLFVRADWINYRGNSRIENFWQTAHLQRMIGAYIAAFTAFLVVNTNRFPDFIQGWTFWILPTIIFTPLIIYWTGKHEKMKTK